MLGIPHEIRFAATFTGQVNTTLLDIQLPDDEDEQLSVRSRSTPIHRRGEGVSTGSIAVLQDVTEQEKLEQARREFVANVSHELRTPLTTIKSYLEALDDGAIEEPQLASALHQRDTQRNRADDPLGDGSAASIATGFEAVDDEQVLDARQRDAGGGCGPLFFSAAATENSNYVTRGAWRNQFCCLIGIKLIRCSIIWSPMRLNIRGDEGAIRLESRED